MNKYDAVAAFFMYLVKDVHEARLMSPEQQSSVLFICAGPWRQTKSRPNCFILFVVAYEKPIIAKIRLH